MLVVLTSVSDNVLGCTITSTLNNGNNPISYERCFILSMNESSSPLPDRPNTIVSLEIAHEYKMW